MSLKDRIINSILSRYNVFIFIKGSGLCPEDKMDINECIKSIASNSEEECRKFISKEIEYLMNLDKPLKYYVTAVMYDSESVGRTEYLLYNPHQHLEEANHA